MDNTHKQLENINIIDELLKKEIKLVDDQTSFRRNDIFLYNKIFIGHLLGRPSLGNKAIYTALRIFAHTIEESIQKSTPDEFKFNYLVGEKLYVKMEIIKNYAEEVFENYVGLHISGKDYMVSGFVGNLVNLKQLDPVQKILILQALHEPILTLRSYDNKVLDALFIDAMGKNKLSDNPDDLFTFF